MAAKAEQVNRVCAPPSGFPRHSAPFGYSAVLFPLFYSE